MLSPNAKVQWKAEEGRQIALRAVGESKELSAQPLEALLLYQCLHFAKAYLGNYLGQKCVLSPVLALQLCNEQL